MKNKVFQKWFSLFFLLILLLVSCSWEYWDHHNKQVSNIVAEKQSKEFSSKFDIKNIEKRYYQVLTTPDKTVIDKIIEKIGKAQTRIYIETYIFTEKRILKSFLDAKKRWVDIEVILESNVYWLWNINKKTFESLKNIWAKVVYAKNYNFTHSKFFIIDNEYIISTWNISYSTYTQNREFLAIWNNSSDLQYLENIFKNDFIWEKFISCNSTIISSPSCSRIPLYRIVEWAKKRIYIYEQSIDDPIFQELLIDKYKSWIEVKLIIWDINKAKSNKLAFDKFKLVGIPILAPKKPYIHAKSFLIDDEILYIWSINLTNNSMENNREIGTIFKNIDLARGYKTEFERFFSN